MATVVYYRQALTGGGATALDAIDGAVLNDGDVAFVLTATAFYVYKLDASSGAAESSPDIIAPDSNPGNKRWLLKQVRNITELTYQEYSSPSSQALSGGTRNIIKSGGGSAVLPELSTLSDGERVRVEIAVSNQTVTLNEHANDSNAETWTGYAVGDFFEAIVVDGAWHVVDERVTVRGYLALTADDAIAATSEEKIFDENYSEEEDIGGWWDAVTNHRLDIGFDCEIEIKAIGLFTRTDSPVIHYHVDGAPVFDEDYYSTTAEGMELLLGTLSSGSYVEVYAHNKAGAGVNVNGDAAKDETRLYWRVVRRLRS